LGPFGVAFFYIFFKDGIAEMGQALRLFYIKNPSYIMQIYIFEIELTKKNFFFLNNCNIKVVFVIKDF
jgi:hypothetical protein